MLCRSLIIKAATFMSQTLKKEILISKINLDNRFLYTKLSLNLQMFFITFTQYFFIISCFLNYERRSLMLHKIIRWWSCFLNSVPCFGVSTIGLQKCSQSWVRFSLTWKSVGHISSSPQLHTKVALRQAHWIKPEPSMQWMHFSLDPRLLFTLKLFSIHKHIVCGIKYDEDKNNNNNNNIFNSRHIFVTIDGKKITRSKILILILVLLSGSKFNTGPYFVLQYIHLLFINIWHKKIYSNCWEILWITITIIIIRCI